MVGVLSGGAGEGGEDGGQGRAHAGCGGRRAGRTGAPHGLGAGLEQVDRVRPRPLGGLSVAGPTTLFHRTVLVRTAQDVVAAADRARLAVRVPGAAPAAVPRPRRGPPRSPTERNAVVPPG